ncbi:hypothetical protein [Paraburkholderia sp. J41]|uniref:hypothetical protein n=1 Tax=Paraburkholderia sp. J41 TaxID=2805433 RepID=UPI002AC34E1B|nr:hypothetical protein [Paraburkholderia sp. J41]
MIFSGERNFQKLMSNNPIIGALERMGYKGRMIGHGFRARLAARAYLALLIHQVRTDVSGAYNRALYLKAACQDDVVVVGLS